MTQSQLFTSATEGRSFSLLTDDVVIKTAGSDTGGAYSLMEWTVGVGAVAPPHAHGRYEESFYVLAGELEFVVGDETRTIAAGDFVRVPPGTKHWYSNVSAEPVDLLVGFTPGGMEELFYKFRTDGGVEDVEAYFAEAKGDHDTEYELPG